MGRQLQKKVFFMPGLIQERFSLRLANLINKLVLSPLVTGFATPTESVSVF